MDRTEHPEYAEEDVPIGKDDTENPEVRKWESTKFDFEPKAHWDLGTDLDILDAGEADQGDRSTIHLLQGPGARLDGRSSIL